MKTNHNNFLKLAFNIAKINLGKTSFNPSVGCVVVKDDSVIASGCTSLKGRPHAEYNALNSNKKFDNSDLYVTMEPCTHYGISPPCTNIISKKGIKRVYFSFYDVDKRTAKKSKPVLFKKKIKTYRKNLKNFNKFYESYFFTRKNYTPYIDAKIAISKDFYTIKKNRSKWITNNLSRDRAHLIRSEYEGIISTSKSINKDNSLLNCRINGLDGNKPDLIIIDRKLKINRNLKIFKYKNRRKIFVVTTVTKNRKISFLKRKGVKMIYIKSLESKNDFKSLFKTLRNYNFNRIIVESGLIFLNKLIKNNMIFNLYLFKSSNTLNKMGKNNISNRFIKKIKLTKKINVNLNGESIYKVKFKHV